MFKKAILATALICGASFGAQAQLRVGAGLMTGMPMGDFGDSYSFGLGGGVWADYFVSDNIAVGLNIGYLNFGGSEEVEDALEYSTSMLPIMVTGDWHFMPGETFDFYAGLGLGLNLTTTTVEVLGVEGEESETAFQIAVPRVGVHYMFSDAFGLDFNTGFNILTINEESANYVPLNLGVFYVFE